jgi:hypothetical protein
MRLGSVVLLLCAVITTEPPAGWAAGGNEHGAVTNQATVPNPSTMYEQRKCAEDTRRFYDYWKANSDASKSDLNAWHENHYNAKLNKCFVLVFTHDLHSDFLSIDLFDANENKHYGQFDGHSMCDTGTLAVVREVGRCVPDSASIWLRGDDQEEPDMHFGWSGLEHGGHPGGPETRGEFMRAIQPFMAQ